ncbi:MAG: hypothetical protein AAF639_27830, partial [Chloroflexota bacterium]
MHKQLKNQLKLLCIFVIFSLLFIGLDVQQQEYSLHAQSSNHAFDPVDGQPANKRTVEKAVRNLSGAVDTASLTNIEEGHSDISAASARAGQTYTCVDYLDNGGFEYSGDWNFYPTENAYYYDQDAYSGYWSAAMHTNWLSVGEHVELWQEMQMPRDIDTIVVDFYTYGNLATDDVLLMYITDTDGNILESYEITYTYIDTWKHITVELTNDYAQDRIRLGFAMFSNNATYYGYAIFDVVNFHVCNQTSPTPTNTSTYTPTPRPTYTPTRTPTRTPRPTYTPTRTPTRTPEPTYTPTHTPTYEPTDTPTPTYAPTNSPTPTATPPNSNDTYVGDDYENNDDCATSKIITTNGTVQQHTFHAAANGGADVDWVRVDVQAGQEYEIEVNVPPRSQADVDLELYLDCDLLPTSENGSFGPGIRLMFESPRNGTAYLRLQNTDPTVAGEDVYYELSVYSMEEMVQPGKLILVAGTIRS